MDVVFPFSWEILSCGQARISRHGGKNRAARVLSLTVLFKGSDSTCLRRLGLSLGSIFPVLFRDAGFRRWGITITPCEKFLYVARDCPFCPCSVGCIAQIYLSSMCRRRSRWGFRFSETIHARSVTFKRFKRSNSAGVCAFSSFQRLSRWVRAMR